ncbi:MAG: sulfite exporter TauE/SafE family protein [Candidatus Peregrinibacteria bacterium]|nr:sulfite exporter TauE/SafE family protein [Candidatus Peregrinibacteria bacterium]
MEIFLLSIFGFGLGLVNSISGGGGVFALPVFLAVGLSPANALALNLISDVGVLLGVINNYYRSKEINWKFAFKIFIFSFVGSIIGAKLIVSLPPDLVKNIIFIGIFIGMFFLLKPVKHRDEHDRLSWWKMALGYFGLFLVGVWDGSIAIAGTTFALLIIAHMFGKSFIQGRIAYAAASTPGTFIAAAILYSESTISWQWPLIILVSNFVGAWVGSRMAIKHGDSLIKKCMVGISILIVIKLIFFP